ncbi:MAG: hypothetical protein B7Z78_04555 [Rhodospirillales bacterium 20-60-12]|nr:MAG: hypothetical protein B7Z78_04555 [Rhodospirillales bacterium 20-60-12]
MNPHSLSKADIQPLCALIGVIILVAMPQLSGVLHTDPINFTGFMSLNEGGAFLPGTPRADPNVGFTTQALGHLVAMDWLHGILPWWNPYSGVGMPLAGEYQPAAFFPLTLLLAFAHGLVWQHLGLQLIAGIGSYAVLRGLGLAPLVALGGGVAYAFNGTLAWFGDAPAGPVAFLPWLVWGVERARFMAGGWRTGWRVFALALAFSLLAGFPETAFLDGLLALIWALVRLSEQGHRRGRFWLRLGLAGTVGLALASVQLWAFLSFLPHAYVGGHGREYAHAYLRPPGLVMSLVAPYAFGPIDANFGSWIMLDGVWENIGGYVDILLLTLAVYGLAARRSKLSVALALWCAAALAKTFGSAIARDGLNLIPGVSQTLFMRYAAPSWEFAFVVLAAIALDDLARSGLRRRPALIAFMIAGIVLAAAATYSLMAAPAMPPSDVRFHFAAWAWGWAVTSVVALGLIGWRAPQAWRGIGLVVLLGFDSIVLFCVPLLSNPQTGVPDRAAVDFLRTHMGLQRFYSLGPIQPNYSAYFGIGSIDEDYLPLPQSWFDYVTQSFDPFADPSILNGSGGRSAGQPGGDFELRHHLAAYGQAGVQYVIASAGQNPFVRMIPSIVSPMGARVIALQPGETARGQIPGQDVTTPITINQTSVLIGTYFHHANGVLAVTLCAGGACAHGAGDLAHAGDDMPMVMSLDRNLVVKAGEPVSYQFTHQGGNAAVALWTYPVAAGHEQMLRDDAGPVGAFGLNLTLRSDEHLARPVFSDQVMTIFEITGTQPYFELTQPGCTVRAPSRLIATTDCPSVSVLERRELFFPGWTVGIDGKRAVLRKVGRIFQAVTVPPGRHEVRFQFAPVGIDWAWLISLWGLMMLMLPRSNGDRDARIKNGQQFG